MIGTKEAIDGAVPLDVWKKDLGVGAVELGTQSYYFSSNALGSFVFVWGWVAAFAAGHTKCMVPVLVTWYSLPIFNLCQCVEMITFSLVPMCRVDVLYYFDF